MAKASNTFAVSEIELVYRPTFDQTDRPEISNSKSAYQVFKASWDQDTMNLLEHFKAVYLNTANRVLALFEVSKGGTSSTVVDPKLIIVTALKLNARSIILCHNHPSGNLKPSKADIDLTHKIKAAATYLDLRLCDHIIITQKGYMSFMDEGYM